ncbi:unnamed protein product [Discosporangium mesarthrocarpum]
MDLCYSTVSLAPVRQYAQDALGMKLSQKGLSYTSNNEPVPGVFKTEEDIFAKLGLEYIPPHLRWA